MYFWWSLCTLCNLHACQVRYCRRLRSLLFYLCYIFWVLINSLVLILHVFWVLINSLVCWFCTSALGLVLFQISVCNDAKVLVVHAKARLYCCVRTSSDLWIHTCTTGKWMLGRKTKWKRARKMLSIICQQKMAHGNKQFNTKCLCPEQNN